MGALHFTARPGAIVTGRMLTPEGAPAGGVPITLDARDGQSPSSGDGATAVDGSYRITGLVGGRYTVDAYSGDQTWIAESHMEVTLSAGRQPPRPTCTRVPAPW